MIYIDEYKIYINPKLVESIELIEEVEDYYGPRKWVVYINTMKTAYKYYSDMDFKKAQKVQEGLIDTIINGYIWRDKNE